MQGWPIPPLEPIALPLPVGLLEAFLLASFALHILAVDVAVGGTVLALVHWARGRGGDAEQRALALGIARMLPTAIALLVNLAIPPLLFLQVLYGPAFYTSSVLMAVPWIAVIPLLIAGYMLSYRLRTAMTEGSPRTLAIGIGSAAALLAIGFVLTNNVTLMLRPAAWAEAYRGGSHGLHLNLADPTVLPRFSHLALGMLAGAGAFVAALSRFPGAGLPVALARRAGLRWFAGATACQLAVGPLLLLVHPPALRDLFLGGSPALTATLWIGVGFGVVALVAAVRGQDPARGAAGVWLPVAAVSVTVACMVLVRHGIRRHALAAAGFDIAHQAVRPDWFTFAVFLVVLAAGALAIFKMAAWVRADLRERERDVRQG